MLSNYYRNYSDSFLIFLINRKYEEINPPNVDELSDMTYTKEEVFDLISPFLLEKDA